MEPGLIDGDRLLLEPVTDVAIGDIVVVRRPSALVVHRVAARTPSGVVTKGDANPREDRPDPDDAIIARVAEVRHWLIDDVRRSARRARHAVRRLGGKRNA